MFLCIEALHHLAIDDEGNGRHQGDGSEAVPDVVCVGAGCCPFLVGGEEGRVGAILAEQEARESEAADGREERVEMAEAQIESLFAFGCLQREILEETGGDECLCQALEDDAYNHHERYGVHGEDGGAAVEHVAIGHADCRDGHDEHADGHGGEGAATAHYLCDKAHRQYHHQWVDVGIPRGRCAFACQTEHVFGHGGVELLLHEPETRDDEREHDKAAVGAYLNQCVPYLTEGLAFARVLCALVEEPDGQKSQKGHGGGEVVECDETFVAQCFAQRLHDGLAREGTDVDHGIEDGEAFGARLGCGLLCHCAGNDALDERTAADDECHDGDDAVAQVALEQTGEGCCLVVLCQACCLEPGGIDGQPEIAHGEQGECQQHGVAETYLVGQCPGKRGQQIEAGGEDACNGSRLDVVEAKNTAQIEGDDDEDAIVCGAFE